MEIILHFNSYFYNGEAYVEGIRSSVVPVALYGNKFKRYYITGAAGAASEIGDAKFYEWLAGLIDGDGYIYERKNGLFSLVITFDIRDKLLAETIQQKLGGNLNLVSGVNAIRYKLHDGDSITQLLIKLNGLIRTKNRIEQFKLACFKYGVEYKDPIKLVYGNGWLSGFFDSDGLT